VSVKNEGTQSAFLSTIQEIVNNSFLEEGRITCP
jgi:hypothetical protein